MTKTSFLAIACVVLTCSLSSLAADQKSFASLPPEAQAGIKAALERNLALRHFTINASDAKNGNEFGISVAIDGNTVVVGAAYTRNLEGAAYVFVKPASGWANMTQTAELAASDPQEAECFGCSVATSGNTIVVGAHGARVNGNLSAGAAYVFEKPAGGWTDKTQNAKLTASDGASDNTFGISVSVNGNTIAVGASSELGTGPGTAYVFVKAPSGWTDMTETAELTPSGSQPCDGFGHSISISATTVLVGAYQLGCGMSGPGAAYIFVEPPVVGYFKVAHYRTAEWLDKYDWDRRVNRIRRRDT